MTRMIERWFPCTEVSEASHRGWGSGKSESTIFPWFAKRPIAQARAAVLTSLLPWPDDEDERKDLQGLVRRAMLDYDSAHEEVTAALKKYHDGDPSMLDLFSGRAMIPNEAARYSVRTYGIDLSPVATMAGRALADYPMRDWSSEPPLPYTDPTEMVHESRLMGDVECLFREVSRRFTERMQEFYPRVDEQQPWGYLWAVTLPCQECGRRFPMTGVLDLRKPNAAKNDPGQSYRIDVDATAGAWAIVVHEGSPTGKPTRVQAGKSRYSSSGKVAVCPFCEHVHSKDVHTRLASEGLGEDKLLLVAETDGAFGKHYRTCTDEEIEAAEAAQKALRQELPFENGCSAVPDEPIPDGNTWTVQGTVYGARTYGDLCNDRQTLGYVRLARIIAEIGNELREHGCSDDYARALCTYASAVMARKLRRSTRGSMLMLSVQAASDIFQTESSLAYSYDYFEAGLGDGPATWDSIADGTLAALRRQLARRGGRPAEITRGSALSLPWRDAALSAVVTDPPYDAMIDYSDASDLFYVWLKRSMSTSDPEIGFTVDPNGVQEKSEEIIVKKGGSKNNDFRTRERYDDLISKAFSEARRVVRQDGVVTIVFGHGEPEVWHRLLGAISNAGLVLTGSWPAKTEKGGKAGFSNIVTTLTMACRPAPPNRAEGRAHLVESEVRAEVRSRVPEWGAAGLAPTDQLMASAGPAMEIVGRYSKVLDNLASEVAPDRYLLVARRAVEEAAAVEIDHLPLETFDARTRFALSWVRLYGRAVAPKSEARWQALAADLDMDALRGVLVDDSKGVRLSRGSEFTGSVKETSSVIDVALAMAETRSEGLDAVAEVLAASGRSIDDPYLWAAMSFLSSRLPDVDPDALAWTGLLRDRKGIGSAARQVVTAKRHAGAVAAAPTLFDDVDGVEE